MKQIKKKIEFCKGMTLLEMVIALAILAIIMSVIMPQFRTIETSWASKQASSEAIQNGRVLIDHFNRNLSKAVRITAVSSSGETDGYIEFEDNDGNTLRYDIAANNYVEYGTVGSLSDLAGPVSQLQFACYDACDLGTPITEVNSIRFVEATAVLTNLDSLGQNKTFNTLVYLRSNGNVIPGVSIESTYDYSNRTQGTEIFAYDGEDNSKVPTNSSSPSDVLSSGEYDNIETDNGVFYSYSVQANSKYAQIRFVIEIDESEGDVAQIIATFNGKSVNSKSSSSDGVSLYIWNYTSSDYELLEASADTEAEVTISGTLTSSTADYIGGVSSDTITLLAASNGKKANKNSLTLFADYIKLEISATTGGDIYP